MGEEIGTDQDRRLLRVAGLFAGIGGIEQGLHEAGHSTSILCEIDPHASRVLAAQFPGVPIVADVRDLVSLPDVELVAAGFPCQDLSQAGRTAGISGRRSGLVSEVFRLFEGASTPPRWLLLENVSFMLHLDRGEGMRYLTTELERLGLQWAYRLVDTRAFGLPQRRQRVLLLASREADPSPLLFAEDAGSLPDPIEYSGLSNGFYWTEGLTGLGWAIDAIPTLKGGSTIGIPSPPAVWTADGVIGTPSLRDAERLQGFAPDWTLAGADGTRHGARWKMVGNAVSVPVARWIGERLAIEPPEVDVRAVALPQGGRWPRAARGGPMKPTEEVQVSMWPVRAARPHLADFLLDPLKPLSARALDGFLSRAARSTLRFPEGLLATMQVQRERIANDRTEMAS